MLRYGRWLLPIAFLIAGGLGAWALIVTGPEVEPIKPERVVPLVRVAEVKPESLRLRVVTHGTVAPRTESELVPEVSGPIVWTAPEFVTGGFFEAGEALVRIDPADYEVALEQARADLARARSEFAREAKELDRRQRLAEQGVASPSQLDAAVASERVAAAATRQARAALSKAEHDLARTELRAPFRGRVREHSADVGEFVNRGAPIATIYAIDYAEIRLPVSDEELGHLELPLRYREGDGTGAPVELRARFAGALHRWEGRVVRTEGEIDPRSRMVNLVARVDDPYQVGEDDGGRPPLAVGLFVEAEILGRPVEDVLVVPRASLLADGRLQVVDGDDRLRMRPVELVRAEHERAVVRGALEPGDRVVLSPLAAPVEGMLLRQVESDEATP